MPSTDFEFEMYRMNIVNEPLGLGMDLRHFRDDVDIATIIEGACAPEFVEEDHTHNATYSWRLIEPWVVHPSESFGLGLIICFKIARETHRKRNAAIQADGTLADSDTTFTPPRADAAQVVCFMARHLAAVEHSSELMASLKWKTHLEKVIAMAASSQRVLSKIHFEAKPRKLEVLEAFRSFSKLIRLKVTLLLPNPDLPRYGEDLYNRMKEGGVQKYLQEMSNPNGLVREEAHLPYAAMALAEAGYKDGEIEFTGEIDGKMVTKKTGGTPERGRIDLLKSFVRGLKKGCKTDEAEKALKAILAEIHRLEKDDQS